MPIPNPELGLVISYAYLWHPEHEAGQHPRIFPLARGRTFAIFLPTHIHADQT